MSRKALPPARKKGHHIQIWLDDDEYAAIQRAVMLEAGRPMVSPWCRGFIMERVRERLQKAGLKQFYFKS